MTAATRSAPVPEEVQYLRSILLVLGLINLTSRQQGLTTTSYTLTKLLQSLLDNATFKFVHTSPIIFAEKGYSTVSDDDITREVGQLVATIGNRVMALLRLSLRQDASHITTCCRVLRCILRPQWGYAAAAIRSAMLKSGSAPLCACLHMCKGLLDLNR